MYYNSNHSVLPPLGLLKIPRTHSAVVPLSVPSTGHPPALPVPHTMPHCTPSHHPSHGPCHVAITTTTITVTVIATVAPTSKASHANPFNPWDSDNASLEAPEVQERIVGPCRRVPVVSTIATWGREGELVVLGSRGPTFFYCTCFHQYIIVLLMNTNKMVYILCVK